MKRLYLSSLILSGVILFASPQYVNAAETKAEDEFIWTEPEPGVPQAKDGFRWFKLTDEAVERIIKTVKEKDPAKAEQLEQLRNNDPNAFETKLRKIMREHFGEAQQMHRQRGMWQDFEPDTKEPPQGRKPPRTGQPGMEGPQMQQRYLHWLEENQPEKADELKKLQAENPELFDKSMQHEIRRHRMIMHAAKESPELAEALKQSMELRDAEKELLEKIAASKTNEQKQAAIKQLEDAVSKRFDLIVKRKQIIYELQKKRIALMQDRLAKIEKEIKKWQQPAFKAETVKKKMEKLISKAEEFKWD